MLDTRLRTRFEAVSKLRFNNADVEPSTIFLFGGEVIRVRSLACASGVVCRQNSVGLKSEGQDLIIRPGWRIACEAEIVIRRGAPGMGYDATSFFQGVSEQLLNAKNLKPPVSNRNGDAGRRLWELKKFWKNRPAY
jgi:hypothetical protein